MDADQDITVASAKDESSSYYYKKKNGSFGRSKTTERQSYESENVASVIEAGRDLTVNTSKDEDGSVSLDGGRNVTIIGSQLKAGNDLVVGATQDVAVLSATEESGSYSKKTKTGLFGMSKSGSSQLQTAVTQVGSQLDAGHDAVILGGRDVRLNASEISAKNDAELHAGLVDKEGDITLSSADDQAYSRAEEYKKKVGLSLKDAIGWAAGTPGFGADMTFATSHNRGREVVSAVSVGSQVSAGNDAFLNAAHDINVIGSGISAVNNASLDAGRDVNVVASIDSQRSNSWETDKSVGIKQTIDSNAFTTFVGGETVQHGVNSKGYTAASSAIDAGMNINVNAGRDINLQGSDVVAENNIRFKAERNINIDAKEEASEVTIRDSIKRNGITVSTAYNIGNTIDGLKGTGKGEDGVSKGSSVLKAVDTLDQFFSGPKYDGHIGASSVSSSNTQTSVTQRPSTLSADNDISLDAGNNVNVIGSRFNAGRDINVKGKDITFDVAHGSQDSSGHSTQSKGGVKGGTNGGFKLGVGVSNAGTEDKSTQGTSTATQLNAGGSINLDAKNDLTLIGTRAIAERDISLKAANDLNILSAQNASESSHDRRSWGAEGGIIAGQDGFGVYGSANVGIGDLNREGVKQQEAYLYAGNKLNFESKRDTTIAGATLRGDEVLGDVGRNLTVSSVPNTGKVEGKEFDASLTVAFSIGATVSGSLGYGETNGKTNWVDNQTVISGKSKVDIRTEKHTQLDGSVVTADNGNLKLDTDTLGYRNITGKDNEHGYYLNVSGSYTGASANGGSGGAQADKPNKGMEGESKSSWAVEGYKYDKDRQQTLNATVGAGQIVVRHDKTTGQDSTSGLNRDVNRAYEITKDEEHRTDLYVSSSSIDAISHPGKTLDKWENSVTDFTENQKVQATQVYDAIKNNWNKIQSQHVDINDVPKSISKEFGEERALAIAKNIVRAGGDLEALESLDPNILKALVDFADKAAVFDGNLNSCIENKTCTVKGPDGWKPGMPYEIGVTVTSNLPRNAGEAMLSPLVSALKLADNLPKEQIQAIGLSIQAIMGPFKLVVSLAAQAALKEAFGPEYERVKEESAINLAAFLTDRDPKTLKEFNDADKKDVNSVLKGDPYVKAAEFLIDSALGEIKNLGIRQVSRVLSVNAGSGAPPKTSTSGFQLTFDKATRIWTTPAGLEYGRGTRQGTRINHVLEHAKPNPNKQNHTVFSMDRKEILGVVDEAWTKRGNPVANDPGAYIVPMGRVVGTAGETNVKVVVIPGTNTVLTAYPVP
jgi:filamentous hemagglutinin